MEFFTANILWLLFAYAVGTLFGMQYRIKTTANKTTELVIDSLIDQGYLMAKNQNGEVEMIKHEDWCNDQDPR